MVEKYGKAIIGLTLRLADFLSSTSTRVSPLDFAAGWKSTSGGAYVPELRSRWPNRFWWAASNALCWSLILGRLDTCVGTSQICRKTITKAVHRTTPLETTISAEISLTNVLISCQRPSAFEGTSIDGGWEKTFDPFYLATIKHISYMLIFANNNESYKLKACNGQ